jgi:hypothetical protein
VSHSTAAAHAVSRADDRDAYVYRILLNRHHDSRRRRWWGEHPCVGDVDGGSAVRRLTLGQFGGHGGVLELKPHRGRSRRTAVIERVGGPASGHGDHHPAQAHQAVPIWGGWYVRGCHLVVAGSATASRLYTRFRR